MPRSPGRLQSRFVTLRCVTLTPLGVPVVPVNRQNLIPIFQMKRSTTRGVYFLCFFPFLIRQGNIPDV
jgi:hypothetical protein